MVRQVGSGLGHAPGVARGANTAIFAGEGDQKVATTGGVLDAVLACIFARLNHTAHRH